MKNEELSAEEQEYLISDIPMNSSVHARSVPYFKLREMFDKIKVLKQRVEWLYEDGYLPSHDCYRSNKTCDFRINEDDDKCPCQWIKN